MPNLKTNILATSLLLILGLSAASAQPDPRFYGVWVGVETYEIPTHGGRYAQSGEAPVKKSAEIGISDSGKTFAVGQGLQQGRFEVSPWWGTNTLNFKVRSGPSLYGNRTTYFGRDHGKLVLSADGNTLTETAVAFLPTTPAAVTCNISGTFHRQGKK